MKAFFSFLRLIALVTLCSTAFSGCAVSRWTTTERTAVERALLSEAVVAGVGSLEVDDLAGKSFYISPKRHEIVTPSNEYASDFLLGVLREHLLASGLRDSRNPEDADLRVDATLHFAEIDDDKMVIGLPSIEMPLAGSVLRTPEIALLSRNAQLGRAKVSVVVSDARNGSLIAHIPPKVQEKQYNRWNFLVVIGWRVTDLPEPF